MKIKLYLLSKQLHRLSMYITSALILVMAGTGLVLKYPVINTWFPFIDPLRLRVIHNAVSPIFGGVLFLMMLTGIYMYIFPLLKKEAPPGPPPPQNTVN